MAVLKSGVHATLAGVAVAIFIPFRPAKKDDHHTVLEELEHGLHPWVAYGVLPVFAFANAGVALGGLTFSSLLQPVPLGIAAGLFVGKQLGIFSACFIAVKIGIARLPASVTWLQLYGVALLCGIGFTMSLFIGSLAFEQSGGSYYAIDDRLGILAGSFCSAIAGALVLRYAGRPKSIVRAPFE